MKIQGLARVSAMTISMAISPANAGDCWQAASQRYGVPVSLLQSIAQIESGFKFNARGINRDGSEDLGVMQINTRWLPVLREYGIGYRVLIDNPCVNIHVGAWILAQSIVQRGFNWRAIGAYNAASAEKRDRYARKVYRIWRQLDPSLFARHQQ